MPPSDATRHEPWPLGVAAMPTIGALIESAPIVAEGIDCAFTPALADVTAVTTAVSVTNEIAVYAIRAACRLCPTINFPLAMVGRCSDRQDRHVDGGG